MGLEVAFNARNVKVHQQGPFQKAYEGKERQMMNKNIISFFSNAKLLFLSATTKHKKAKTANALVFKMKSKMQNQTIKYFFNQKREREPTSSIKILAFIATLKAAHWVFKALY